MRCDAAEVPEEKEARLDRQRGVDGVVQLDQRRWRREELLGRQPRTPRPQWQERQSRARPHAAPAQLGTGRKEVAQSSKVNSIMIHFQDDRWEVPLLIVQSRLRLRVGPAFLFPLL